ncbi:phosphatase and actin regulator 2 [Trichonephila clavipes]|nr:phosphatase and actin regulator 2 [Trichonephila clavipes]
MKTSSVEFISRSPTPSPMNSNYRRFVLLRKIFEPWQWKRRKKRNRFEQTSRTLQRKISMRSTKDQLVKKDFLMPVKHNVFLWNLPDVEEVPSHDGETILLWSPWKYRCGQRTVRMAVVACSQNQAVFASRRNELKLKQKLLDIRAELERERRTRESAKEGRNWNSPDTTNVNTKKVYGLNWRPFMISKAIAELGQRFRVSNALWIQASPYSRNFRHNRGKSQVEKLSLVQHVDDEPE